MANPEHIQWLLEGVDAWNARRINTPFVPDLSGVDVVAKFQEAGQMRSDGRALLGKLDLSEANLKGANLAEADLTLSDLSGADLTESVLALSDLTAASLAGANFTGAELFQADLSGVDLNGAIFANSKPWKAILAGSWAPSRTNLVPQQPCEVIKTVGAFIDRVQNIAEQYENPPDRLADEGFTLYFRGEHSSGWQLRPSLMRSNPKTEVSIAQYEGNMLLELISRRPSDFNGLSSALAEWVLGQHHGLKTRFLDVTKNPLVALFNACCQDCENGEDHPVKAGRLHIFAVPQSLIKPFNSAEVSVIANFAKLNRDDQDLILGKPYQGFYLCLSDLQRYYRNAVERLQVMIRAEKPYFTGEINLSDFYKAYVVEPQQSAERIRSQSSSFLVSAFHERFEKAQIQDVNETIPVYDHYELFVPDDSKSQIMKYLRLLNITQETLFPGLDSSAAAITRHYSGGG